MLRKISVLAVLTLVATLPTLSGAQGLRDSDVQMDAATLMAALSGQGVEFFDQSSASYHSDGSYAYRYRPGDPPFEGTFTTTENSQTCVTFDNGFARCDTWVRAGDRLVLITEDGLRFPARAVKPLSP